MKSGKKKIAVIIIGAGAVIALTAIVIMWLLRDFDASGYTKAILDQTFLGDATQAAAMIQGQSEEELCAQYEEGIESFVDNNVTNGTQMDEETREKYVALCKKIFASMKYEVLEAKKISGKEYQVPVEYRATDIFFNYVNDVTEVSAGLMEKVEKGEYQGTVDEINAQMQTEFISQVYDLLEQEYEQAGYGDAQTMTLTVKEDENGLFSIEDTQLQEFVAKILGLDEILD